MSSIPVDSPLAFLAMMAVSGCALMVVDLSVCSGRWQLPESLSLYVIIGAGAAGSVAGFIVGGGLVLLILPLLPWGPMRVLHGLMCVGGAYMAGKWMAMRRRLPRDMPRERYGAILMDVLLWDLVIVGPLAMVAYFAMRTLVFDVRLEP